MNAINQSLKNWVSVEILMNTLAIGVIAVGFWKTAVDNLMLLHFMIGGVGIILIPRLIFLIGLWQDINAQIKWESAEITPST